MADIARKVGLFPETMLPSDENLSWEEYYDKSKITPEMLALGQKFLEYFELPYEWVNIYELSKHIKHSPIQVIIPGHAVVEITKPDPLKYFDTYNPFIKSTTVSNLNSALKVIINYKQAMNDYVKTINLDGEVAGYVPLRNEQDIDLFNKIFNKDLVKQSDGSIPTDIYATRK